MDDFVITQQDGFTDTLCLSLNSSFQHGGVYSFCKDNALRVCCSCRIKFLCKFGLLSKKYGERAFVFVPVLYFASGYTTVNSSLGYSCRNLRDESRVNGFGDEIVASESQVVNLVDIVHNVRDRLLGQVCNGIYGSKLHLFVDSSSVNIQSSAENVGEADDIVDLVRVVCTSC